MTDRTGHKISVGRNMTGHIVTGDGNITVSAQPPPPEPAPLEDTLEDTGDLKDALDRLRRLIEADGDDRAGTALAKLGELEEAVFAEPPDLATMEHVRGWFARRFPRMAAAVGRVVVSPIVDRLAAAAGEEVAEEFRRRFHT
ncbi:hypothetical protein N5079_33075 [Planotetraspora sp. A-T 1434]|uniref:hypothetical protein n=1 Tax=Planotetraspora sp. A-T 1434 TaxID=2979219 RepID=UPI0021BDFDB0|nr:hypothetical protein [Planotetraspora sp. A-T 1434]MCT9935048.1 hypothetical protein [Planotetraspora sp. A-T 1434]